MASHVQPAEDKTDLQAASRLASQSINSTAPINFYTNIAYRLQTSTVILPTVFNYSTDLHVYNISLKFLSF